MQPAPGPAAGARKPALPLALLGIGCAVVLLLVLLGGLVAYLFVARALGRTSAVSSAAPSAGPLPSSVSPVCRKAHDCCQALERRTGPSAGDDACQGLLGLAEAACVEQDAVLKRAAAVVGVNCE